MIGKYVLRCPLKSDMSLQKRAKNLINLGKFPVHIQVNEFGSASLFSRCEERDLQSAPPNLQ